MRYEVFCIQRGVDGRWYVSHFGSTAHSFPTQLEAEEFARRWATANQPSTVQLEFKGQIEKEWKFGDETPGIRWRSQ